MTDYHLFWHGPFSQWHPSKIKYGPLSFNCAEQFMMYHKAVYFKDHDIASQIMATDEPAKQKGLGRQVAGFDIDAWAKVAKDIVFAGNLCKFTQNLDLCRELVNTYPKVLVEASPWDKIWGIGLAEDNPDALDSSKWKGKNWLGEVLTGVRENIMSSGIMSDQASATMYNISGF